YVIAEAAERNTLVILGDLCPLCVRADGFLTGSDDRDLTPTRALLATDARPLRIAHECATSPSSALVSSEAASRTPLPGRISLRPSGFSTTPAEWRRERRSTSLRPRRLRDLPQSSQDRRT